MADQPEDMFEREQDEVDPSLEALTEADFDTGLAWDLDVEAEEAANKIFDRCQEDGAG